MLLRRGREGVPTYARHAEQNGSECRGCNRANGSSHDRLPSHQAGVAAHRRGDSSDAIPRAGILHRTYPRVTKLPGEVEITPPEDLPNDGKVIEGIRKGT